MGANVGARQFARARRVAWSGGLFVAVVSGLIGGVVAVWPDLWLANFTADAAALAVGARYLAIVGPFEVTGISDNPTRRMIFSCRPTSPEEEVPCAESIISRLVAKAYRRPATQGDVDELMPFYYQGAAFGGFEGEVGQDAVGAGAFEGDQ